MLIHLYGHSSPTSDAGCRRIEEFLPDMLENVEKGQSADGFLMNRERCCRDWKNKHKSRDLEEVGQSLKMHLIKGNSRRHNTIWEADVADFEKNDLGYKHHVPLCSPVNLPLFPKSLNPFAQPPHESKIHGTSCGARIMAAPRTCEASPWQRQSTWNGTYMRLSENRVSQNSLVNQSSSK